MLVFDIESWPNVFIVTFKKYMVDESYTFVISEYRDDREQLYEYITDLDGVKLFGFNSWHYDSPVLQYCIDNESLRYCDWDVFCLRVKNKSDELILSEERLQKTWKWIDIDGFKYWSMNIKKSKRISLKSLGIQMNYPYVMELPYPHYKYLTKSEIEKAIEYNAVHDINMTEMLAKRLESDIKLREAANEKYNFNSLSWDGVKLGFNILLKLYADKTNKDKRLLMNIETNYDDNVPLKNIILPHISYEHTDKNEYVKVLTDKGKNVWVVKTPYKILQIMRNLHVNSFRFRLLWKNIVLDLGKGGLHSVDRREIIEPQADERLIDVDFSSYYPHLIWKYNSYSRNFPEMPELAGQLIQERIACKKSDPDKANLLKLALNGGLFGTMKDVTRPNYDPVSFYTVTINGQLILLKLVENISAVSEIISVNTDGVTVKVKKQYVDKLKTIVSRFEHDWKIPLEFDYYDKIIRENVNNYIALRSDDSPEISKGKAKKKGNFQTEPVLGDSCNFLVIPKAVEAYFVHNTPIEEFIMNHNNIYDFCGSAKVDKSYQVVLGEELLPQRLNRYYPCKTGSYLYKVREGKKYKMPGVPTVKLLNKPEDDIDIDYSWFISRVKEKVEFIPTLF